MPGSPGRSRHPSAAGPRETPAPARTVSPTGSAPSPLAPLRPTARLLAVPGALALLFAALVGLRLHGFSLAQWNVLLGEPARIEVWLGEPRAIRADDYAVILPLALAQEAHDPPFPVVNRLVGTGQNALLPFSLPVAHPLVLLRPDTWGFFLGADVGLAWRWWSRTFGLFLVAWALLRVVTRGDGALAAFGALALVASPFVQLWTLRPAPVAIHTGLLVLAALGVLFARRAGAILLSGLLLGYAAAGFALVLYPPFQVPLASVALLLAATLAWEHRDALDLRARAGLRLLALGAAGAVVGLAATAFWATAGDAVTRMLATAYPGRRVALGGGRSWAELAAANLGVPLLVEDYGPLLNACEAASFWLLSPVLLAAVLWRSARGGRRPGAVESGLAVGLAALALHATTRLPGWLVRATGWSLVPGPRSMIALGLVEVLLVARLLASGERSAGGRRAGLALAWGGLLGLACLGLARRLPGFPLASGLAFAGGNAALAWLALGARRPWHAMAGFAAASAAVSLAFNPLAQGGAGALRAHPLAAAIRTIDAASGGTSVWATFGPYQVPNLFRALGVRAIDGVQPVPQLEQWARWDPRGRAREVYDRYAHVSLVADAGRTHPRFRLLGPDAFAVDVDPGAPALAALGVTHLLVEGDGARRLAERGGARWLRTVGRFHLLEAARPEP